MRSIIAIFLIIFFSIFLLCCEHSDRAGEEVMDKAETIMEEKPDSALLLLLSDVQNLSTEKSRARHALLLSMAYEKNYIDTTSLAVLQPAMEYYYKSGSPTERLRTHLYEGMIHLNRGDDEMAMKSVIKAKEYEDKNTDTLSLARVYSTLAILYFKQYKTDRFIECNLKAASLYSKKRKRDSEIRSYARVVNGAVITNNKSMAYSFMRVCMNLLPECPEETECVITAVAGVSMRFGTDGESRDILSRLESLSSADPDSRLTLAHGYLETGNPDRALHILSDVRLGSQPEDSLRYFTLKKEVLYALGRYQEACFASDGYARALRAFHDGLHASNLLSAERSYRTEVATLEMANKKNNIIWGCIFAALIAALSASFMFFHSYRYHKRCAASENANKALLCERDQLMSEKASAHSSIMSAMSEIDGLKKNIEELRQGTERLKEENAELKSANERNTILSGSISLLRKQIVILNKLFAKAITKDSHIEADLDNEIKETLDDAKKFIMERVAVFAALYPVSYAGLWKLDLSNKEVELFCLLTLGLSVKECGEYMGIKSYYNMTSSMRKKLGIDASGNRMNVLIRNVIQFDNLSVEGLNKSKLSK